MATLRVSPWEYSDIVKNSAEKTEAEFVGWALMRWPFLLDHLGEGIRVEVDYGIEPPARPRYILLIRSIR
jgi:hypothetical protein